MPDVREARASTRPVMRQRLRVLHLALALAAGLFVVMLGLTGSVMAFETELDHVLHRSLWHVDAGPRALTLAELTAAVGRQYPGEAISSIALPGAPDLAARVSLPGKPLFVDPYTGRVVGIGSTSPDVLARIHQLHLRLLWMSHPDDGKAIVSWMCVAMLGLLATGLVLWWPLKRFSLQRHGSPRRFWLDLHASTGIAVFGFLVLVGLTGAAIGFDDVAEPAFYRLTGSAPSQHAPHEVVSSPSGPISPDRVLEIARSAIPGATPFLVAIPGPRGVYSVRMRFPEDLTPGGRSRVEVDPYTGQVTFAESSRTAPAGTRAVILNRALHTGDVFGLPSKILVSLASALTAVMAVSGLLTWWARVR